MTRDRNFADPRYEPTDDDFAELLHEAFGGLGEARAQSLEEMWLRIDRLKREAAAAFEAQRASAGR